MTRAPQLFVSVVGARHPRRSLAWAALGALSLHVGVLVFLLSVPARELPPPASSPEPLTVTLLDAPELGARRSEGLAGGDGSVVLGVATTTPLGDERGSVGAPAGTHGALGATRKRKPPTRGASELEPSQPIARAPAPAAQASPLEEPPPQPSASSGESPQSSTSTGSSAGSTPSPVSGGGGIGTGGGAAREGLGEGQGRGLSLDPFSGDTTVLAFGDGMKHPKLLSKVDPVFTKEAREAGVKGLILTKCVISTTGRLSDCQIVKGIPLMNQQVLSALRQWRYEPVLYRNRPVSVRYLIPVRLQ